MEQQQQQQQQINIESFELLKHIPEPRMKILFDLYTDYTKIIYWIRPIVGGVFVTIMASKLFFGGKSYPISEYNNIMTTTITIASIFCLCSIILGIIALIRSNKLKSELREVVNKYKFSKAEFLVEFNALVKHFFGGPGIKKI